MIKTRVVHDPEEMAALIPACNTLAGLAESALPFHQISVPLLWWKHFGGEANLDFGQRRGRNFWGVQSWVEEFHLLVAEEGEMLYGVAPLVSILAKISRKEEAIRLLSFAGDSVLIAYQDILASPTNRYAVLNALFEAIAKMAEENHALLFLGNIPENSPNLPHLRAILSRYLRDSRCGGETINRCRGGMQPWTIGRLLLHCKVLQEKLDSQHAVQPDLAEFIVKLEKLEPEMLLLAGTRMPLQEKLQTILTHLKNEVEVETELTAIAELLNPRVIPYPYLKLPKDRDAYLKTLSKETRRYFRRYKARFTEEGGYFEKISPDAITSQDIDDYLHLHALRWQSNSAAVNDLTIDFHRDLATTMAKSGHFHLFFANHRGRRVAAHSCFDINTRREGYFTGRDPAAEELRAGRLLYMETILDAIDHGFAIYDLGYGGDEYKLSFTDTVMTVSHFLLVPPRRMPNLEKLFPKYEYVSLEQAASSP